MSNCAIPLIHLTLVKPLIFCLGPAVFVKLGSIVEGVTEASALKFCHMAMMTAGRGGTVSPQSVLIILYGWILNIEVLSTPLFHNHKAQPIQQLNINSISTSSLL